MAEEQRPSGLLISKAIRSEQQSSRDADLAKLEKSLAKRSLWKTNTLQRNENARSELNDGGKDAVLQSLKQSLLQLVDQHWQAFVRNSESTDEPQPASEPAAEDSESNVEEDADTRRDLKIQNENTGMRKALALQVKEVIKARRRLREQEAVLQEHSQEIERLRQTISQLQDEKTSLSERHKDELNGQKIRLVELQEAYDQFQHQSDQLLSELDAENVRLRSGDTHRDKDSQFSPVDFNA